MSTIAAIATARGEGGTLAEKGVAVNFTPGF